MAAVLLSLLSANPAPWKSLGADGRNTFFQGAYTAQMTTPPTLKWTRLFSAAHSWFSGSHTVDDVTGDGTPDVLFPSYDGNVYCLNGITGAIQWQYPTGTQVRSAPATGDVNLDGATDVCFGNNSGTLFSVNGVTGALNWSLPGAATYSCPKITNLDGDPQPEVIVVNSSGLVQAVDGVSGTVDWSNSIGGGVSHAISPAFYDLDNDGVTEVVATGGSTVRCINGDNGMTQWSYTTGYTFYNSPVIEDVDMDGQWEVVVGTGNSPATLYVLDGATGVLENSTTYGGWALPNVFANDFDWDGVVEIVAVGQQPGTNIQVFRGDNLAPEWTRTFSDYIEYTSQTVVGEIDIATPGYEVVSACRDGYLRSISPFTGADYWSVFYGGNTAEDANITIADVDGDSCVEIIVSNEGLSGGAEVNVFEGPGGGCQPVAVPVFESSPVERFTFTAAGFGELLLTLAGPAEVTLSFYDIAGRLARKLDLGTLGKGPHRIEMTGLPVGVYLVAADADGWKGLAKSVVR